MLLCLKVAAQTLAMKPDVAPTFTNNVTATPRRVIEIYGPEASGKTTLALHVIAEAQKKVCAAGFVVGARSVLL